MNRQSMIRNGGGAVTNKRDLTAEELSSWWKHGIVLIGLSFMILSWWIGNA